MTVTQPTLPPAIQRVKPAFEADILTGLGQPLKTIPCRYFYDAIGSALFEEITELPEYYPTRTELSILTSCATAIAQKTTPGTVLVEFGSGSSVKTDILLAACPAITQYVPIDVSGSSLASAVARLARAFPQLQVEPVLGDFTAVVTLPAIAASMPKLGFFPGSTIGNFGHEAAVTLLAGFRNLLGTGSRLIIGADLRKSPHILIPAYNDAAGVTAAFNLNLLVRINRDLGGTFNLASFEHLATYDEDAGRIDMWLVSKAAQTVRVAEHVFQFEVGERIHTEISQKYGIAELQSLAARAGWRASAVWTDADELFCVQEFIGAS
jgi:dimethylhistidine N-methyltransferase